MLITTYIVVNALKATINIAANIVSIATAIIKPSGYFVKNGDLEGLYQVVKSVVSKWIFQNCMKTNDLQFFYRTRCHPQIRRWMSSCKVEQST